MKNKTTDEQINMLLREAVHQNYEDELDRIPPRESLEKMYTFSEKHNEQMKALFSSKVSNSTHRGVNVSIAIKWVRTVAAIISVVMTIAFCVLLTSPQVRTAVADTLLLWDNKLTNFVPVEPESTNKAVAWRPQYVPDGFVFKGSSI